DEKTRVRTLPALGFLGQGPWFYDNGAVEVTRADERHDRIDVVSRGFLGLTVGCARCHNHKYDPILTTDYYAMAGVFASTTYKEYPQVPTSVVDQYTELEKRLKNKEKSMGEFLQTESKQLSESLTLQTSKYIQAGCLGCGRRTQRGPQRSNREEQTRLRADAALDQVSGEAASLLSISEGLAGDGAEGWDRRRSQEARRRLSIAVARCPV